MVVDDQRGVLSLLDILETPIILSPPSQGSSQEKKNNKTGI